MKASLNWIREYVDAYRSATYLEGRKPWHVP